MHIHGISLVGGSHSVIARSGVFSLSMAPITDRNMAVTGQLGGGDMSLQVPKRGQVHLPAVKLICRFGRLPRSDIRVNRRHFSHVCLDRRRRSRPGDQDWSYTPDGLPAQIITHNDGIDAGRAINTYQDNRRRLLVGESASQPGWYTWNLGYGYDANGGLAVQTYPGGGLSVDYAPNALGQPTRAGSFAHAVGYYPNGAIRQFTYGNGIVHTMEQNARQLPQRVTSSGGVLDYDYAFDTHGNVERIYDLARGDDYNRWMQYDGLDRLTAAGSASFGGDHWHRYTYDVLDNLRKERGQVHLSKSDSNGTGSGSLTSRQADLQVWPFVAQCNSSQPQTLFPRLFRSEAMVTAAAIRTGAIPPMVCRRRSSPTTTGSTPVRPSTPTSTTAADC